MPAAKADGLTLIPTTYLEEAELSCDCYSCVMTHAHSVCRPAIQRLWQGGEL